MQKELATRAYQAIQTLRRLAYAGQHGLTLDQTFSSAPAGDFEWRAEEAGDWTPTECDEKDCPHDWHKFAVGLDIGRKGGKRFITRYLCDQDGDWDTTDCFNEADGDSPDDILAAMALESPEYFFSWAMYDLYVAENGTDPLDEWTKQPPDKATALEQAEGNVVALEGILKRWLQALEVTE